MAILCILHGSVLRALTRAADRKQLAALIEKDVPMDEIREALTQLFSFFKEVKDNVYKKPVIESRRNNILSC